MPYTWVFLALISAFTLATSDALTKKALAQSNEYLVAWFRLLFSIPLLLLFWIFVPVPKLDIEFYKAFALALPLEIIAIILYIKALRISPLSLTLPFLSLTPVFLILVSYLIIGEKVSFHGSIGIIFLAAGSYALNLHKMRRGVFQPFRAITKEKGSVLMLGVALIYSITSSLGKMAIEHSSPLFFGATYFAAIVLLFTPIALYKGRSAWGGQRLPQALLLPGIFYSLMVVSHMVAMSIAKVAYVISVKRMSLLIGVFYGYLFFKEKNIRERLSGAMLMFVGFLMIVNAA